MLPAEPAVVGRFLWRRSTGEGAGAAGAGVVHGIGHGPAQPGDAGEGRGHETEKETAGAVGATGGTKILLKSKNFRLIDYL